MSHDRVSYCPECQEKGKQTQVKEYQIDQESYLVLCSNKENCSFHRVCKGFARASEKELIECGLPGELLKHMDVNVNVVEKIFRICLYEYCNKKYFTHSSQEIEYEEFKELFLQLTNSYKIGLQYRSSCCKNPIEILKKAVENSIADISLQYRNEVKEAFSKITDYNFPDDFMRLDESE